MLLGECSCNNTQDTTEAKAVCLISTPSTCLNIHSSHYWCITATRFTAIVVMNTLGNTEVRRCMGTPSPAASLSSHRASGHEMISPFLHYQWVWNLKLQQRWGGSYAKGLQRFMKVTHHHPLKGCKAMGNKCCLLKWCPQSKLELKNETVWLINSYAFICWGWMLWM